MQVRIPQLARGDLGMLSPRGIAIESALAGLEGTTATWR